MDGPPPARVAELEEAVARAWEPFAAGKYSMQMAERLAAPFQAQLDTLRAEYAPARTAPVAPDLSAHAAHFALALSAELDMSQKRRLMTAVNARFYIGPDGLERLTVDLPTLG
ncbi:hypothetical protein GCM10022631_04870 [Deinococcus rubellus]|uniref:Uncharacterized protein n=1 Tax=Deinococcus rubellus TaxID=1889240 RepID=A0ABY5YGD7_9DEIO|nr:hypothetical protein [Deinococcus rubellus]UWX64160.1 hypothetical protein N0D28_00315 [Deinococcus rubellus]